jgi:asparagine synthase (glutamine-hydrolysing)
MAPTPAPGLLGSFPELDGAALVLPPTAKKVWPDRSTPVSWGTWRRGEFRVFDRPEGRLVLIGQCFADDARVAADLAEALRSERVDLVTRWPGSYLAMVITADQVTAFVDLAGQYPLYYVPGRAVVFGTSPLPTAASSGVPPRVDPLAVSAEIYCGAITGLTRGRTPLSGLRRLEAGEALRVTTSGALTRWAYEGSEPARSASFDDCAAALRETLDAAVSARVATGHVSTDFSGGLDSTSVAFLAARHRAEPLHAFTYHHPDTPADDLDHAVRNAGLSQGIRLEIVGGTDGTLPYRNLGAPPPTGLPDLAAAAHERNHLRLRHVADQGEGVHLGGEGADALLVAPPSYLGDLASGGQWRRLVADSRAWARLRDESPTRVFDRAVRLSTGSDQRALRAFAQRLQRSEVRHPGWVDAISRWPPPGLECAWLTGNARRALVDHVLDHADRASTTADTGIADRIARDDLRRSGAVQQQLGEMARSYGVWPQAPFLDNDVIRCCTAIPAYRRAVGTTVKPLLKAALEDVVPAPSLARRTKGDYSGEDYRGARREVAHLRELITHSPLADLRLIEPQAVLESVDRALLGVGTPFPALNRLIAFDLWLRSIQ